MTTTTPEQKQYVKEQLETEGMMNKLRTMLHAPRLLLSCDPDVLEEIRRTVEHTTPLQLERQTPTPRRELFQLPPISLCYVAYEPETPEHTPFTESWTPGTHQHLVIIDTILDIKLLISALEHNGWKTDKKTKIPLIGGLTTYKREIK